MFRCDVVWFLFLWFVRIRGLEERNLDMPRTYPPAFREQAVGLLRGGRPVKELSVSLGVEAPWV